VQKHISSPSGFDAAEKGIVEKAYNQAERNETLFNMAVIRPP
jgi:hypothetical protein